MRKLTLQKIGLIESQALRDQVVEHVLEIMGVVDGDARAEIHYVPSHGHHQCRTELVIGRIHHPLCRIHETGCDIVGTDLQIQVGVIATECRITRTVNVCRDIHGFPVLEIP